MNESDLIFEVGQLRQAVRALTSSVKSLEGTVQGLVLWKVKLMATSAAVAVIVSALFEMGKLYVQAK